MLKFHFIHNDIIYVNCPNKLNLLIFMTMMCMTHMRTTITMHLKKKNGQSEFLHQKHHFATHIPNFVFSKLSKFCHFGMLDS